MSRPSWDSYFMEIAGVVSKRSTCLRHHFGALIVKDKRILSSGFNGAPSAFPHCLDTECMRDRLGIPSGTQAEKCFAVHAEMNVVAQAAKQGISIDGGTLYINGAPCSLCVRLVLNSGIQRLVYVDNGYPDAFALDLLKTSGIEVLVLEEK